MEFLHSVTRSVRAQWELDIYPVSIHLSYGETLNESIL